MIVRCLALAALACTVLASPAVARDRLHVAQYEKDGQLAFPKDTDRWITMGATLGGEYRDAPFDPTHPSTMGVVQMEPKAYAYFRKHGEYADGTMLLLSFYKAEGKMNPQLSGFVEGDLQSQEIHVIDRKRFEERRAFFVFPVGQKVTAPMPKGSECVSCHRQHGAYDGTFLQFYPVLREIPFKDVTP